MESASYMHTANITAKSIVHQPSASPRNSVRATAKTTHSNVIMNARMLSQTKQTTTIAAPRLTLAGASACDKRVINERDPRLQRAPPATVPSAPASPAPPRTSAYDSPAMRSAQSSQSGSNVSLATDESEAEEEVMMTPSSPTPSMELDFDFQMGGRALRRRRSPDETAEEEAKRHCLESLRLTRKSPTFAEAARRPPSPRTNTRIEGRDGVSSHLTPNTNAAPLGPSSEQTTANKEDPPKKNKRPRYPPLVVEKLPNWATHFRAIAAKLGRPPNARPFGQGVRFSPESEEEYRVVQRYLTTLEKESGVSWFAYSLPADKKLKVAIRGLPADTDPQDIEEELRTLGYQPEYVRHINARQGRPGCVFYAILNKTENVREIYDTSVFMLMRGVKIEAWRGKRGPAQCHRCQQFRHSSHQCHRPLACVRCGEGHVARDCPRPREEPATCANCGGPHPACNIKCPVFQREIKHRRAGTVAITTTSTGRPQKVVQAEVPPTQDTQAGSLMAAANGPTIRGEAAPSGRGKNKRGGKGRRPNPPSTQEATRNEAPASERTQAVNNKKNKNVNKEAPVSAGIARTGRHLVANTQTTTTNTDCTITDKNVNKPDGATVFAQNRNKNVNKHNNETKDFTACAIKLLMDLIKAIRQGQDVEQVILDGLAALLTLYHG